MYIYVYMYILDIYIHYFMHIICVYVYVCIYIYVCVHVYRPWATAARAGTVKGGPHRATTASETVPAMSPPATLCREA